MIIVTGAAGFIGSCMINKLNNKGFTKIVAVDDFSYPEKNKNLLSKSILLQIDRSDLFSWLDSNHKKVSSVYHLGARTDTAETDTKIFDLLNINYSKKLFSKCTKYEIPLIYASSAATYGLGEYGFKDDHKLIKKLKPLNPYGESKNIFDLWVLEQKDTPPFWAGMKFFNVYGPNEYHKGRMASVVFHAYKQIKEKRIITLFRSHNNDFKDGEQKRDFIYVKDVVSVLLFMMTKMPESGIYNLGSGVASSFNQLAEATFKACNIPVNINYIDTPEDIRDKYQYYTCAQMDKFLKTGYVIPFYTLSEGISDYVQTYLALENYY